MSKQYGKSKSSSKILEMKKSVPLFAKTINSPIGKITLVANEESLVQLSWGKLNQLKNELVPQKVNRHSVLDLAEKQLHEYFSGKRLDFTIPLAPCGTPFQKKAWSALRKIPYGKTISYGEQAKRIGNPKAVRAIGGANGKNPIGIIVPCHRVVGADGSLTGFTGGLSIKKKLLELESVAQHSR